MSERALRGTRLGATSYETESGIEFAARQDVAYACSNGHSFTMPFAVDADVPAAWECKVCGAPALLVDGEAPEQKKTRPQRSHWDMLLERRTVSQLEEVLAERLEVLRSGRMGFTARVSADSDAPTPASRTDAPATTPTRPAAQRKGPSVTKPVAARKDNGKPAHRNPAPKNRSHSGT